MGSILENVKELAAQAKDAAVSAVNLSSDERDILHVLKRDHDLVDGMIASLLEHTDKADEQVQTLVDSMVMEIRLHSKTEEKVVYEACKRHGKDLRKFALEGFIEHDLVDELLNQIVQLQPGPDGQFQATLTVLKEILHHHVREEEGDLFPLLRKEFNDEQLLEMGLRMESLKQQVSVDLRNGKKARDEARPEVTH